MTQWQIFKSLKYFFITSMFPLFFYGGYMLVSYDYTGFLQNQKEVSENISKHNVLKDKKDIVLKSIKKIKNEELKKEVLKDFESFSKENFNRRNNLTTIILNHNNRTEILKTNLKNLFYLSVLWFFLITAIEVIILRKRLKENDR